MYIWTDEPSVMVCFHLSAGGLDVLLRPNSNAILPKEIKCVRTGLTGSRSGVGHVHQRPGGLGQGLVVDRVRHRGGLLFLGVPKVVVGQQHRGPVVWGRERREDSQS